MSAHLRAFSGNAYLMLAAEAIRRESRPLTPAEMLEIARLGNFLPSHLFGATMHKTLAARLAEHIRSESGDSLFYRTAPAKFFLHELAAKPGTPREYKSVYVGHLRSKSIRKENVLVAARSELARLIYGQYTEYDNDKFEYIFRNICKFMDRSSAERDETVKQFVTFTLVYHESKLLFYRRGKFTTTSKLLQGQLSVGFGGHVNDMDFDLFTRGENAFRSNAARELKEELFLDKIYKEKADAVNRANILGYINVDDSPDAEHHIAVLVAFNHKTDELPKKGELSINQLGWLDLKCPLNDLSDFDLWSGMILKSIYDGQINLGRM